MQLKKIIFMFLGILFYYAPLFAISENIEAEYENICWDCYNPEIPIQNFLLKYREILRNLCFKKDAKACYMMAKLYTALHNDIDAQDYWQKSCKLGIKKACPMVEDEDD